MTLSSLLDSTNLSEAITRGNSANALVNKYVVAPLLNFGIAGFIFDIEDETKIDLRADITDHYAEDNTALQDHIAIRPVSITIRGYVGEVTNNITSKASTLTSLTQKVTIINSYLPILTSFGQQVRNIITSKNTSVTDYIGAASSLDLYATFQKLNPPKTKQAAAYNFFYALMSSKQMVSLATPYTFYNQLAIESISATQSGINTWMSDFSLTLKLMRTASTSTVAFDSTQYQNRVTEQAAPQVNKGVANGAAPVTATQNASVLSTLWSGLGLSSFVKSIL